MAMLGFIVFVNVGIIQTGQITKSPILNTKQVYERKQSAILVKQRVTLFSLKFGCSTK